MPQRDLSVPASRARRPKQSIAGRERELSLIGVGMGFERVGRVARAPPSRAVRRASRAQALRTGGLDDRLGSSGRGLKPCHEDGT